MTTLSIFFWKSTEQAKKDIEEQRRLKRNTEINELLKRIKSDYSLWDMRTWEKYKDRQEVRKWIRNGCHPNNCGHVEHCIEKLLGMKVSEEMTIEAIMANPHETFNNRIVPCCFDPMKCPRYRKFGNYSDCNCSEYCDSGAKGRS